MQSNEYLYPRKQEFMDYEQLKSKTKIICFSNILSGLKVYALVVLAITIISSWEFLFLAKWILYFVVFCCFFCVGVYTAAREKKYIAVYASLLGLPIEGSRSLTKPIFQHYYHAYEATHSDLCMLPHNLYSLLTH